MKVKIEETALTRLQSEHSEQRKAIEKLKAENLRLRRATIEDQTSSSEREDGDNDKIVEGAVLVLTGKDRCEWCKQANATCSVSKTATCDTCKRRKTKCSLYGRPVGSQSVAAKQSKSKVTKATKSPGRQKNSEASASTKKPAKVGRGPAASSAPDPPAINVGPSSRTTISKRQRRGQSESDSSESEAESVPRKKKHKVSANNSVSAPGEFTNVMGMMMQQMATMQAATAEMVKELGRMQEKGRRTK